MPVYASLSAVRSLALLLASESQHMLATIDGSHVCGIDKKFADIMMIITQAVMMQEEVPLGNPDILICSVGTEIFFEKPGSDGAEPQPDKKWIQLLDQGWNRQAALDAAAQLKELVPQVNPVLMYPELTYVKMKLLHCLSVTFRFTVETVVSCC